MGVTTARYRLESRRRYQAAFQSVEPQFGLAAPHGLEIHAYCGAGDGSHAQNGLRARRRRGFGGGSGVSAQFGDINEFDVAYRDVLRRVPAYVERQLGAGVACRSHFKLEFVRLLSGGQVKIPFCVRSVGGTRQLDQDFHCPRGGGGRFEGSRGDPRGISRSITSPERE